MIRLDTTTRILQLVLSGAVSTHELPVVVCYSDKTATTYTGATTPSNSSGTTPVTICAAPAAATVRDIDYINIDNQDTALATVTVLYNDNGTTYQLLQINLEIGDQLTYTHASGWKSWKSLP